MLIVFDICNIKGIKLNVGNFEIIQKYGFC